MVQALVTAALLTFAATPPGQLAHGAEQTPARTAFQQAIGDLWKDAQISSDDAYRNAFAYANPGAIAPSDMRRLVIDWPQTRSVYRGFEYSVSIYDHWLTCMWDLNISSDKKAEDSVAHCSAALTALGYVALKQEEITAFGKLVPKSPTANQMMIRKIGDTQQLVVYSAVPYVGSTVNNSGIMITCLVRRPYDGSLPKLSEVLAVVPGAVESPYLGEKFYASLADEPIVAFTAGHPSMSFDQPIADKIIAALEREGFEYQSEKPKLPDGSTQKTWYRYTDITFAHVITSADGKGVRFNCQPPQHKGPPITKKPPARHPSLALPHDKRPILTLEELRFADERLAQQAKRFHDLAGKAAQPNWQTQLYQDVRYSAEPRYFAEWRTSKHTSTSYLDRDRPYQNVSILLTGRNVDGADQLTSLSVGGRVVPSDGWAALVACRIGVSKDGTIASSLEASVGRARANRDFSFEPRRDGIRLTGKFVTSSIFDDQKHHYSFQSQLPPPTFERTFSTIYGSPETLRDQMLADIDALRKLALGDLAADKGLSVTDTTNVRSDNPPIPQPPNKKPASPETKKILADDIEKQLGQEEKLVRENFHEIHAALQLAFPAGELLKGLSAQPK